LPTPRLAVAVNDRDINLAGDANRSAHRARRSFKAQS
jgi:hypothetical protein